MFPKPKSPVSLSGTKKEVYPSTNRSEKQSEKNTPSIVIGLLRRNVEMQKLLVFRTHGRGIKYLR